MPDSLLVITLESRGLVEAVTTLDRMDASLRDMHDLKGQFDTLLAERLAQLSEATPVDTGVMQGSWDASSEVAAYEYMGRITNSAPHAAFVAEGTGIYGPPAKGSGEMIVAKQGKPFVFWSKKFQKKRVLTQHKGQPANPRLNDLIRDSETTLRAAERRLRGDILAKFQARTTPGIIVQGGE